MVMDSLSYALYKSRLSIPVGSQKTTKTHTKMHYMIGFLLRTVGYQEETK